MTSTELAESFSALGFELRIRILEQLALSPEPLTLSTISALMSTDQKIIGHHMRLMAQSGVLLKQPSGRFVLYGINKQMILRMKMFFSQISEINQKDLPHGTVD